jgi:hypothetical protein
MTVDMNEFDDESEWSGSDVILIVDADEVIYQVAAACESRGIAATNKTNEFTSNFKTRTDMKKFLNGLEVPEDFYEIADTQIAEPIKNACATIKAKLYNLKSRFKTSNMELYFSGKDNFRLDLPLPEQYKANRKDTLRPLLLSELKEYLIKYHGAIVVQGDEADQMVAQRMYDGYKSGKRIIGITQDKDALSSVGHLYNPVKNQEYFIEGFGELTKDDKGKVRGQGRLWLYFQICMGDWSTDHFYPRQIVKAISGTVPKFGEVAAYKLLSECKTDKEALKAIHDLYLKWFGSEQFSYKSWNGETFTGDYLDAMQLIWDCAFMKRFDGDDVCVRSMLEKLGII